MIELPWQLQKTREHLARMEDALVNLRIEDPRGDPSLLRLSSQGLIDQIKQLRAQIAEYQGTGPRHANVGPAIEAPRGESAFVRLVGVGGGDGVSR